MARYVTASISGISPLIQSRKHNDPKLNKSETADAYEARTWRSKAHIVDGCIAIPSMAFKQALEAMGKHLGMQIPGKGKSTYTKHLRSGVSFESLMCVTSTPGSQVAEQHIYCNSDGVRGSGKRVDRIFPLITGWKADVKFLLFDDALTDSVFEEHLNQAGILIGVGAFRVENGGLCGRFKVDSFKWGNT